ncbi:unnamed protein product [Ambrosiozyma monospora]|uniref:Unnamed protein product n=1 Tax=Ambrosiozyma monospora TaxID=43982 RepID=A0ACB5SRS3_AMBMO|nr:unnamed protein product [Ambrosiozyma monospora]
MPASRDQETVTETVRKRTHEHFVKCGRVIKRPSFQLNNWQNTTKNINYPPYQAVLTSLMSTSTPDGKTKHARVHLPLLLNPMLNHLFNNPLMAETPKLNNIIKKISSRPGDYAILVPDEAFIMLNTDKETGKPYKELCFEPDFIESHIIDVNQKKYHEIKTDKSFRTLNKKEILINRDIVTNFKGFKHDFKLKIIDQYFFKNFAPYIPFGMNFHIIVIEEALVGIPKERGLKQYEFEGEKPRPNDHLELLSNESHPLEKRPFDDLVMELPELAVLMGEQFKLLFRKFAVKGKTTDKELNDAFMDIMSEGSSIINSLPDDVFNNIHKQFPNVDLHESIYSYIELHIYDKFWLQYSAIKHQDVDNKLNSNYETLQYLSINQVGLPKSTLYNPDRLIIFEKRVLLAIAEFKKLEFSNQSSAKVDILIRTFKLITTSPGSSTEDPNDLSVDADTLISLFVVVLCSSKVKNLNAHLRYIKDYSFSQEYLETGFAGYVISSFEATLNYLNEAENFNQLLKYAEQNRKLWDLLKSVSTDFNENNIENDSTDDDLYISEINSLLEPFKNGDVDADSFIRSRTSQGESCLMLSVLRNSTKLFKTIASFDYIFTLDDILEDRNINGLNLLNAALQSKNIEVIDELADIILQAEDHEIKQYCNKKDVHGRNLGHFLFHRSVLISRFGPYINWIDQDNTGQTPLFAIVRCYDHPDYAALVKTAIDTVADWYASKRKPFNYQDHIDSKGNTLIHSISDGEALKYVLGKFEVLDLNALNINQQTPLTQFIRYNK